MKLIKASYEILTPVNRAEVLKAIEVAGRTCYKSEEKITEESASDFVKMIIKRGHNSVIEHRSMTVKFICDRGVSHELVRHRIASFSQESTRYCNYSKDKFDNQLTFIIPEWIQDIEKGEYPLRWEGTGRARLICDSFEDAREDINSIWFWNMANAETTYGRMIGEDWLPQQARSILPNSLKTEIVVTANFREWKEIFRQRCSPAAHPQMRELMLPLWNEMVNVLPEIFKT